MKYGFPIRMSRLSACLDGKDSPHLTGSLTGADLVQARCRPGAVLV